MSATISPPQTFSAAEREEIVLQLNRLLASSYFSNSRRFPSFLRYIVQETLAGNAEMLKERTIGVEIFQKEASYDTSTEPIVRVTAAEIRKRIAQYYQESGHSSETRVSLPPGSYVPYFEFVRSEQALVASKDVMVDEDNELPIPAPFHSLSNLDAMPQPPIVRISIPSARSYWRFGWPAAALIAFALLIGQSFSRRPHPTALQQFWQPITDSGGRVLVSVPDQTQFDTMALRDAANPTREVILHDKLTAVIIDDLNIITNVTGVLQAAGKPYTLRGESVTNLSDLREGPSVLIGAFNNEWTLRLTRTLRFQFANAAGMTSFSIVDTKPNLENPAAPHTWTVDRSQQMATNNYIDYAIVARFTDETTGRPTLIAAGIGRGGTTAAGEFLTSPHLLSEALQKQPSHQTVNFEAVLSTRIIDGQPGTPSIEGIYFW